MSHFDKLLDSCITDMQTIANSAGDETVCEEVAFHAANKIADARRIAVGLLAALEECVTDDNAQCIVTCDVAFMIRRFRAINKIARAAIAKAEGSQS
jgi:hypothetical protein